MASYTGTAPKGGIKGAKYGSLPRTVAIRARSGADSRSGEWFGKNASEGNSAPPCAFQLPGGFHEFLWPVVAGNRTFSISCKHLGLANLPSLTLMEEPALGVARQRVAAMPSGAWQVLALAVAVKQAGVLRVRIESYVPLSNYGVASPEQSMAVVLWDNVVLS